MRPSRHSRFGYYNFQDIVFLPLRERPFATNFGGHLGVAAPCDTDPSPSSRVRLWRRRGRTPSPEASAARRARAEAAASKTRGCRGREGRRRRRQRRRRRGGQGRRGPRVGSRGRPEWSTGPPHRFGPKPRPRRSTRRTTLTESPLIGKSRSRGTRSSSPARTGPTQTPRGATTPFSPQLLPPRQPRQPP